MLCGPHLIAFPVVIRRGGYHHHVAMSA